jgi:hypothetical protein
MEIVDMTRNEADLLFCELMQDFQVNPITCKLMYFAVRIGGKRYWC